MYKEHIEKKLFGLIKIKESSYVKKIYFCGIQICLKRNNNCCVVEDAKIINSIYTYSGFTEELIHKLEFIFSSPDYSLKYDNYVWLIYLHSLIERNFLEKAKAFLKRYVQIWGLHDLEKILIVAEFTKNNNITNEKIEKSAKLSSYLKESSISDYFKNKTIAIVGNSGCELGKNKGKEIDSHEIVIRFSNYPEDNKYFKDYGQKTSVWIRNLSIDAVQKDNLKRYEKIIQHGALVHRILSQRNLSQITKVFDEVGNNFINIPEEYYYELNQKYSIYRPTAGCILIWYLYKILGSFQNVDIYGFSFLSKDYADTRHYFDNVCKIDVNHDMKLEIDLLYKLYFNEEVK